jgi:phosphoglycerate dehydrogenase-like enzyme
MSTPARPVVAFAMSPALRHQLFSATDLARLERCARPVAGAAEDPLLPWARDDVEVLITGWGTPELTDEVLDAMPRLRWVLHAAGSVKHHLPPSFWRRDIKVASAADANAVPVAEYTLAMILLANKGVPTTLRRFHRERRQPDLDAHGSTIGNYAKRIGLVGASRTGRRVAELLRPFDLEVVVSDPYVEASQITALGATLVDLDELCATSDVVSLHAPDLPETRHMIDARRISVMQPGVTLVNTARGALVDTDALTAAVLDGRLRAVLDVTDPPVLPGDSPLWDHDNVVITPHVAGSLGYELWRMGALVVDEVARVAQGRPLHHAVRRHELSRSA